jgi:hypothetical protein
VFNDIQSYSPEAVDKVMALYVQQHIQYGQVYIDVIIAPLARWLFMRIADVMMAKNIKPKYIILFTD